MEHKVENLVREWDDVYKKGQLSLWILLAIADGPKYSSQINEFMLNATKQHMSVKEQSLYRALRRFKGMGIVSESQKDSPNSGVKRKYYSLTDLGEQVLSTFIQLQIAPLYKVRNKQIIHRFMEK